MLKRFHKLAKVLAVVVLLFVMAGVGAPYFRADYFSSRIQEGLEQALGRKVSLRNVRYNVFQGPGFQMEEVTISEDPRIGIEPIAHVAEMQARVDALSLLKGQIRFSNLRMVEPTVNLTRAANGGPWNVELLLGRATADASQIPAIQIRDGRLNFKFGDRKEKFYFGAVDLDLAPSGRGGGSLGLTASAEPFRNDMPARTVGRVHLRTSLQNGHIDGEVEGERASIAEIVKLLGVTAPGWKGFMAASLQFGGSPEQLKVSGEVKLDDLSGGILLPKSNAGALPVEGTVNLRGHEIVIGTRSSESPLPLSVRFAAKDYLAKPEWNGSIAFRDFSAPALFGALKQLGANGPEGFGIEKGAVSGNITFARESGLQGDVEISGGEFLLPSGGRLTEPKFQFLVTGANTSLRTHSPGLEGDAEAAAAIDGKYDLETRTLDVKIQTSPGKAPEPLAGLTQMIPSATFLQGLGKQGSWKGNVRYLAVADEDAEWFAQADVMDAHLDVPGMACPVVASFSVALSGGRLVARNLRGNCGTALKFTGDYRYEPKATIPHRLNLAAANDWNLTELESALRPTLARGGFLSKTLRLGRAPAPEWLTGRKVEGTFRAAKLQAGAMFALERVGAKYTWTGSRGVLTEVAARTADGGATVNGEIHVDLSGFQPKYNASGSIGDADVSGGQVDFNGALESEGLGGTQLLSHASAKGAFRGRAVRWNPEWLFEEMSGNFTLSVPASAAGGPKVTLTDVALSQGGETYQGGGATQADGKLVLEVASAGTPGTAGSPASSGSASSLGTGSSLGTASSPGSASPSGNGSPGVGTAPAPGKPAGRPLRLIGSSIRWQ
ncbi:MAG: AsmA family protein [Acidobacteria bacterium]|nr:AsmA family protein [Acidobacteriota bacterium]